MDVRQLRYFVSVIELRSFTRAAEVLHIAQPALGMQIRKLEDELHTPLLSRHSRGVEPTAAGNLLRERAVAILKQVEEAKQAIHDLSGEPRGIIRFGTTPAMHPRISIGLLQRSAIELPNVQIQVQEAVTATLVEWVRTERVDIALAYLAINRPKDVVIEDLAHESAVFVQSPTGAPKPATISLAEVCQHTLVMPGHPHHLRELFQSSAEQAGLEAEVTYEIGAVSTILEMVERNIACAVLPSGAVARYVSDGRLLARRIVAPELRVTLSLVRSSHRALSKAHLLLCRLLAELAVEDGLHPAPP